MALLTPLVAQGTLRDLRMAGSAGRELLARRTVRGVALLTFTPMGAGGLVGVATPAGGRTASHEGVFLVA
jgi:hypothetical protein